MRGSVNADGAFIGDKGTPPGPEPHDPAGTLLHALFLRPSQGSLGKDHILTCNLPLAHAKPLETSHIVRGGIRPSSPLRSLELFTNRYEGGASSDTAPGSGWPMVLSGCHPPS